MFSSESDAFERFNTLVSSSNFSRAYSRTVEANIEENDWDNMIVSAKKITILFCIGIALICIALCITICWQDKKPAEARSATSTPGSWPRSSHRSAFQKPRERLERCWSKVFSMGPNKSKGWPAIRMFRSRLKSQAGDMEMQRVRPVGSTLHWPRDWTGVTRNQNPAGLALLISTQDTRRLQRPEHLRTDRGSPMGWRVEAERQRLRDAWDRLEISVPAAGALPVISPPYSGSQPRAVSLAIPEHSVELDIGQVDYAPLHMYGSITRIDSPAPSIPEVPPPTYAQHTDDEVAYLHDYQDPAHAAEGVRNVQGLPPYTLSWLPAPAPVLSSHNPLVN